MLTLKLTKIGNSIGAVFPKEVLQRLHAQEGDKLFLIESPEGYKILIELPQLTEIFRSSASPIKITN